MDILIKILITGAAGFCGSNLSKYLKNLGHDIINYDNLYSGSIDNLYDGHNLVVRDIRNSDFVDYMKGVKVVFHCAAIAPLPVCQTNPLLAYDVNVSGTANVLEAARRVGAKVVFFSTSAVYEANEIYPFKEDDIINPHLTYSLSKKHCEELCHSYSKLYNMDITILRLFNMFGPGNDFKRKTPALIPFITKSLLNKKAPLLHSDGSQRRDMVYVDDMCRLCNLILYNPLSKGETYNIASNDTISVGEIYNKIKIYLKSEIEPVYRDPKFLWDNYPELELGNSMNKSFISQETNKYSIGSYDKANKMFGWKPEVGIDEGIAKTIEYQLFTKDA